MSENVALGRARKGPTTGMMPGTGRRRLADLRPSGTPAPPAAMVTPGRRALRTTAAPAMVTAAALTPPDPAVHVLHRTSFGVKPAELDEIDRIGVNAYIERQLDPGSINDGVNSRIRLTYPDLFLDITSILHIHDTDPDRFWDHPGQLKRATLLRALLSRR